MQHHVTLNIYIVYLNPFLKYAMNLISTIFTIFKLLILYKKPQHIIEFEYI